MKKETTKTNRRLTASKIGRMGGEALLLKHGKDHMRKIAKLAAKARWGSKPKKK